MKKKSPAMTVTVMMAITLAGKLLGIVRDNLFGARFGAETVEGVAFYQASGIPRNFLDIMFASVFSASFIPIFNKYLETKNKEAAFDLAALFISVTFVLTSVFTVLCVIFTPSLFGFFLDGQALQPGVRELAVPLLRIMFPLMILSGLAFSLTGVLQSLGEFKIPAAMSAVSNGIIIIYYFTFADRYGVWGLSAVFLIGWASQIVIQVPFLIKNKFRFRFRFDLKDEGLREILKLALPVIVASWLGPVNLIVAGKAIGMSGGPFDYVGVNNANTVYTIVSGVFVLSVANVIFPQLSKQAAAEDGTGFKNTLSGTLKTALFFLLPMSAGLAATAKPLIRLMYENGLYAGDAVNVTAGALAWFSVGIIGYGLQILTSRACYALMDGVTPTISSVVAMVINAALCFLLVGKMGAAGAALAGAVSVTVAAVWMLVVLRRKGYWGISGGRASGGGERNRQGSVSGSRASAGGDLVKMIVLTALTYIIARVCVYFLPDNDGMSFALKAVITAVPVTLGGAVYLGGAWVCGLLRRGSGKGISFKLF